MTQKGFTLIELLVVVLIIGILSAVALPQYQKAVKKSRAAEVKMLIKKLGEAEEAYFLANNTYTQCLNDLDVDILPAFSKAADGEECVSSISKGSGNAKIFIDVSRYVDNGSVYGGATNWTLNGFLGNHLTTGNGGYGMRFGFADSQREPLSCIEYACHTVAEGSFCRNVMGITGSSSARPCVRFYHE
ncbi:MAG: prepilin-type N-terminal cleavage/methylation domain-containing protein [Elusimicrobiaceae bacterium]|nr:prepilin-type N-terminal cleavage/methylation domain-containing protein [Elusimicrobiaceae bacterium]